MFARRQFLLLSAAALPVLAATRAAHAAEPAVFQDEGFALGGTDTVAYFEGNGPVAGDRAITATDMDATWAFASVANRDAFMADPAAYAPAFGGYCAFAASRGYVAPTVPEAWTLHEGRLFLNASLRVRRRWERELPDVIAAGEANWPAILG